MSVAPGAPQAAFQADGAGLMMDSSQQQQVEASGGCWTATPTGTVDAQLLSQTASMDPRSQRRSLAVIECPKSMVGRVIGKNGETIRALQTFTGALIQINQTVEPTQVTLSGTPQSLSLAVSMVQDIVRGSFKGFALLRQIAGSTPSKPPGLQYPAPVQQQAKPLYAPGYGLIPPPQVYGESLVMGMQPTMMVQQQQLAAGNMPMGMTTATAQAVPIMMSGGGITPSQTILSQQNVHIGMGHQAAGPFGPQQVVYGAMPMAGAGQQYMGNIAYYPQDYSQGDMYQQQDMPGGMYGGGGGMQHQPGMQPSGVKIVQAMSGGRAQQSAAMAVAAQQQQQWINRASMAQGGGRGAALAELLN